MFFLEFVYFAQFSVIYLYVGIIICPCNLCQMKNILYFSFKKCTIKRTGVEQFHFFLFLNKDLMKHYTEFHKKNKSNVTGKSFPAVK